MSVTIITINLSGKYIGADFMSPVKSETINLLLLQLIAKSHEIMVVASLSVVVMDFVRHELIFGGGVPLGLISAGINFNRFDLFLRKELYGSLGYTGAHALQRLAETWWNVFIAYNDLLPNYLDDRIISAESSISLISKTHHAFPWLGAKVMQSELTTDNSETHIPRARSEHGGRESPEEYAEPGPAHEVIRGKYSKQKARIVVGCSVQTGWVPSTIFTDKYRFWTGWNPWNIKFKSRTPAWDPNSGASTNGRVSFGFEWLNLWAPKAPIKGSDTWGPSTIKNISSNTALLGYAQINITGATSLEGWLNDRELGQ
ncbi:hypothetical protein AnigIFM63604_002678 [Aspergillus niger]|uniref:Uncharacterized protein n=1 Tax=Aspergillus niger TaxID=5061 RepID=A0A9W6A9T8_ASPNG|nr:hypothetical protein AnigIFM63604_002678 [Aspergillus niger]